MQLTRHSDYALRVLLYLVRHADRHCTIGEIASAYAISHNHLMKVVHELGKAGYVASVRGRHGGIHLARAAQDINIGAVLRDMERDFDLAACGSCTMGGGCGLQGVLAEAVAAFLTVLHSYSLADVAARSPGLERLLSIAAVASAVPAEKKPISSPLRRC